MNEQMITDYVRTRHADLLAEAAAERTATTHRRRPTTPANRRGGPNPSPATPGPTASGTGHSLRRRAARALHTLANAIDPHPTPH
ncbi:hypothetical protein [Nonomuraea endophytica]|uniref:Uncharacterized protein n=1 Tax=Nonomuraea endophytica TaxID=714136 RepID=A0A7W8AAJ0_9ACTN|nr:hypothetical protein [Nonomuraea endophytica]MBB5082582.1 hypothetical protein [Nonomuraea endophytica]